jgi:hypothetical protein
MRWLVAGRGARTLEALPLQLREQPHDRQRIQRIFASAGVGGALEQRRRHDGNG